MVRELYPLGGLRQSKIVNRTLRIVIRCELMVAMQPSQSDVQISQDLSISGNGNPILSV